VTGITSLAANTASPAAANSSSNATTGKLHAEKLAEISQLEITDRHVRAHEEAHLPAAGPYATGGPSYTFATGPDGQRYAVGGEVSLDTSPDPAGPEATIQKAETIQAAANAPADPSTQDRMVAAQAAGMEADAEAQIFAEQQRGSGYSQRDAPELGRIIAAVA
jgi:SprA-related family